MAATIASLNIDVRANTTPFVKGLDAASAKARSFAGGLNRAGSGAVGGFSKLGNAAKGIGGQLGMMAASASGAGGSILGIAAAAGPMAAVAAPVAAAAAAVYGLASAAETFNQSLNQSLAIMKVDAEQKAAMTQTAIDVAKTTVFSADKVAKAYYFLASAGLTAEQSVAAMPQVAKFAQAGMFDLSLATDLATDAQSALGLTVKDAQQNLANLTRVTDVLVKANTLANASVEQFSTALTTKAGAALRLLNKDIEEGVAVLAALADQGIKGEEAGTNFAIVLRDLTTKAIENKAAFEQAGVAVFDQSGNMRNMADILGDLEGLLDGASDKEKKMALMALGFSDKSVAMIAALIGTSDKVREYQTALEGAAGTTGEVADKQMTNMQRAMANLKGQFVELALKFGPVMDGLAVFVDLIALALKAVTQLADALGKLIPEGMGEKFKQWGQALHDAVVGPEAAAKMAPVQIAPVKVEVDTSGASEALKELTGEMEGVDEATKAAQKSMEDLAKQGENLAKSLRKPDEVFRDSVSEFKTLLENDAISYETYNRAMAKSREELMQTLMEQTMANMMPNVDIGAAVRGTTGGFAAEKAGTTALENLAKEAAAQKKLLEEIKKIEEEAARDARNKPPVKQVKI